MASDKDRLFEKIYFLWKGEGEKRNQSIDWYCERYGANIVSTHCMALVPTSNLFYLCVELKNRQQ